MSSPISSSVATDELKLDGKEENNENGSVHNLSDIKTSSDIIIIDEVLPPEVAVDDLVSSNKNDKIIEVEGKNSEDDKTLPILKIVFRDDSIFRSYNKKIESFLKGLFKERGDRRNFKCVKNDLLLEIFDVHDDSRDHCNDVFFSKEKILQTQPNDVLFTVDIDPKIQDDHDIPMYGKKFNMALQEPNDDANKVKVDCAPKLSCFNCFGSHNLRDCDQPRDYAAITKNKKDRYAKKGSSNLRYHLDDDQKFGHFVPGKISSNLRKALGINENDLPKHIYRMRDLGYPPGWLEEARLQHSGLSLFDSEGHIDQGSDEEGEIICPGDKDKYDIKKILDFPGFNVMPPQGTREECDEYWVSTMHEHNSKSTMLSFLSSKKASDGYKRKRLSNHANHTISSSDLNAGEMDLDEIGDTTVECVPVKDLFVPPLPKDNIPEPPPPPPSQLGGVDDLDNQSQEDDSNDISTATSSRDCSPSLLDLEYTKKQLLAELDESSTQSNPDSVKNIASTPDSKSETLDVKTELSTSNKINVNNVTPKNSPKVQSMFGSGSKAVIGTHLGTPILHSDSPFKRLPAANNFSRNICDVINFENLPDSTGKYDQIAGLLQKVRNVVAELQKE